MANNTLPTDDTVKSIERAQDILTQPVNTTLQTNVWIVTSRRRRQLRKNISAR